MKSIVFHMLAQSLETDSQYAALEKKMLDAVKPDDRPTEIQIGNLAIYITCTRSIDFNFDDTANEALIYFREWWERRAALSPLELWEARKRIAHSIMNEWDRAFGDAQKLFDVPTEQKSKSQMTDEEKAEAETPDSPLVAA